jgi:Domain of unknown function (DUF4331)
MKRKIYASILMAVMLISTFPMNMYASSHREAPLLLADPQADNTDLYAFRSPDNPDKVIIIANYYPFQLPQGGPNYYQFGENVRYEIHIDNNAADNGYTTGDNIVYRFTFSKTNEDATTFFNIRLGKQNLKTTYLLERSTDGGVNFQTIVSNGIVPPPNIGPRSISSPVGLNAPDYNTLINDAIATATTGEKVFCGTADDPFFVDLGGVFDLGDAPRTTTGTNAVDGLKCKNVCTIALQVDIATLQKNHKPASQAASILDPDYVVGLWASASRRKIRTLNGDGTESYTGSWVQVSRLGMPLTNEVVTPIGTKDLWNALTPYEEAVLNDGIYSNNEIFANNLYNPELALYMDDSQFGSAVPAFAPLRIQTNSLGMFDFRNGKNGLFSLKGSTAVAGTALDDAIAGKILLPGPARPRSVDLFPIFRTGVPNLRPYQLATGKGGDPLAAGKPFINNFLPNGGDMLRLNMAVPPTPRNDPKFSSLGLIQAAVLGLTDPAYNGNTTLQFIPNMDGFPNGRRLEDDVTRIELQAVSGVVLAAIGLSYEDPSRLVQVLTYTTKVEKNDTTLKTTFPYEQTPWPGTCNCAGQPTGYQQPTVLSPSSTMRLSAPELFMTAAPNPVGNLSTIRYRVANPAMVNIQLYDAGGHLLRVLVNEQLEPGSYSVLLQSQNLPGGVYLLKASANGQLKQSLRIVKN